VIAFHGRSPCPSGELRKPSQRGREAPAGIQAAASGSSIEYARLAVVHWLGTAMAASVYVDDVAEHKRYIGPLRCQLHAVRKPKTRRSVLIFATRAT
jgi:hypothetical protein